MWIKLIFVIGFLALVGCQRSTEQTQPVAPAESEKPTTASDKPSSDKPVLGELTKAVIQNDSSRVSRLIEMGADVNENIGSEANRITPLLAAIVLGNEPLASALIIRGASPLATFEGYDAVDLADHLSMTKTLELIAPWR